MNLVINGNTESLSFSPHTLLGLLTHLKINPKNVVVELNGEMVKDPSFAAALEEGCCVEIIHFVGGGG